MSRNLSRREMLKRTAAAGVAGAIPTHVLSQTSGTEPYRNLAAEQAQTLEAVVARLVPSDSNGPGALEAGAARYIDRALGDALAAFRETYVTGLTALDAHARSTTGKPFTELAASSQDDLLRVFEQNRATNFPSAAAFFNVVLNHTLEGTFSDPHYGGNRDFIGWDMLGYPGLRLAVTADQQRMTNAPSPTRLSAYDLPMFEQSLSDHADEHGR